MGVATFNGLPDVPRVTQGFINFGGVAFDIMVVVAIRIHAHREKDEEVHEDGGKPLQGLEFDPEVKRIDQTEA
jgi:hypothetical protein